MRKTLWALMACLLFVSFASAAPGAIRCGRLLEVRGVRLPIDQIVVFDDRGSIATVGPAASTKSPEGISAIDLSSVTCLPGLIDVHTHNTADPTASGYQALGISVLREAVTGVKNARITLRAGFTTVRNVGATGYTDVAVRDGIEAGEIEGPRTLVSGPPLGITGGHCDNNLLPAEYPNKAEGVADSPWAAREKVREVIRYGADVIKVMPPAGCSAKATSLVRRNILWTNSKPSSNKLTSLGAKWPLTNLMVRRRNPRH
jgi:imidazolonepropionase-like amidohydrolase